MRFRRFIKKVLPVIKEPLGIALIYIVIAYLTLFIAFIIVLMDCHSPTENSDWFLENFVISESELNALHHAYAQLAADQEPLGHDFEKVLHENRWNLYES